MRGALPGPWLQAALLTLARDAGAVILKQRSAAAIGADGLLVAADKADGSPVTPADLAAHTVIAQGLAALTPEIPLVSEEDGASAPAPDRAPEPGRFWLVDPLDGTREFRRGSADFTVNIALIDGGVPRFGVVFAPALDLLYWGAAGLGAWRDDGTAVTALHVAPPPTADQPWRVVASRSHLDDDTRAWIAALGDHELLAVGSSLKFCRVAEGAAHVYPRLAPTHEWDTAAAQAVLEGAGGQVCTPGGARLAYGRPGIPHPDFIAALAAPGDLKRR